jgi:hypothetical protein
MRVLSPFEIGRRLQRSRDWYLLQSGRVRRAGLVADVVMAEAEVIRIDGYLAELGFAPRPPMGPAVA